MPVLVAAAKFQLDLTSTPALPSVADFELNSVLAKVVQTELNCVKASLIESKNKYQKDIRGELKHSLLSEQKIQHKNINVSKLASCLADRLSKSRKVSTKLNEKCFYKSGSKSSSTSKTADLKSLLVKATSASHRARGILKRCSDLSEKYEVSTEPIHGKLPLVVKLVKNSRSKSMSPTKSGSSGEHDTECNTKTSLQKYFEEFEPEDYQSILETNIARYRENINLKSSYRGILNDVTPGESKCPPTIDSESAQFFLSKRPSLSTFASSKSTATVFESNLNSVHKKLRINPHPLAIYNNLRQLDQVGEEGNANEALSMSRKEKFNNSSELKSSQRGPISGASEILYLKLLLLTENASSSSSSGPDNIGPKNTKVPLQAHNVTAEEDNAEEDEDEDAEAPNQLSRGFTKTTDHLFSFHPVQKHTPLHHTHRPTQSILKKNSSLRNKIESSIQQSDQLGIDELFPIKRTCSSYDSSLSDFSATGYFVPRTESSAPILTSLEVEGQKSQGERA